MRGQSLGRESMNVTTPATYKSMGSLKVLRSWPSTTYCKSAPDTVYFSVAPKFYLLFALLPCCDPFTARPFFVVDQSKTTGPRAALFSVSRKACQPLPWLPNAPHVTLLFNVSEQFHQFHPFDFIYGSWFPYSMASYCILWLLCFVCLSCFQVTRWESQSSQLHLMTLHRFLIRLNVEEVGQPSKSQEVQHHQILISRWIHWRIPSLRTVITYSKDQ